MQHVTPKEAAKILGVHVSSLRRWENEGKLKAIHISRDVNGARNILLRALQATAFTVTHDSIALSDSSELTDAIVNQV